MKHKTSTHGITFLFLLGLVLFPLTVFAEPQGGGGHGSGHASGPGDGDHHGNPAGPRGRPGAGARFHHENPPGPLGGQRAGPLWRDNPDKMDNPPGPLGGRGTDWGNPPEQVGSPGAGPLWRDNPNKMDNPPGPIGGPGTDWKNPPGSVGGPGTNGSEGGPANQAEREMRHHRMRRQVMKRMLEPGGPGADRPGDEPGGGPRQQ